MDAIEQMLKELTEAQGVSGYEEPIREVVKHYLGPLGELSSDRTGSVICRQTGTQSSPKVMIAAHMDEVGFMVKLITPEGFLRFTPLGGWFDQVLLAQRVVVKTRQGDVVGTIGAKPPHLLSSEERGKVVSARDMYIDIGATSEEEVKAAGVRVGDPVVPRADFVPLATGKTYLSKALDDRIGVAVMIAALRELQSKPHPNTVYGVATVMEEVGLRGATTSVEAVDPDVAIILESDIAGDVPGVRPEESAVRLGKGPSIIFYDRRMIPNLKLRDLVMDTAQELGIPVQTSALEGGATDGGVVHLHKVGVPTIVLAVPARHIHSHSSIVHRDDFDHCVSLVGAVLQRLDAAKVAESVRFVNP